MKHLALALTAAFLLLPGLALANYLGDVTLDKGAVADLGFGTTVGVDFSYKVDAAEGARIRVLPYVNGSLHPGGVYQDPLTYPQGTGTGSTQCSVFSGDPTVDQIVIQMLHATQYEVFLELAIPVDYRYSWIGVFDIQMSPDSPAWFTYGDTLFIDYNYNNTWPGDIQIFPRPFYNGELCSGYHASGSPHLAPGLGSEDGIIYFDQDQDVDAIRFQAWTTDDPPTLQNQFFVPVDYHWGPHGLCDFEFSVDSLSCQGFPNYRTLDQRTYGSLHYTTTETDPIYITVCGARDGSVVTEGLNYLVASGLTDPEGDETLYFWYSQEQDISQACISMGRMDGGDFLLQAYVPLNVRYRDHVIQEPVFAPGGPAILDSGEHISVDFAYATMGDNPMRIWPFTYTQGVEYCWGNAGSPPYYPPDGYGSSYAYAGYYSDPLLVDQIMFLMTDDVTGDTLENIFYPAHHWYGSSAVATGAPEDTPGAGVALLNNFPNPFNPSTTLRFTLDVSGLVELAIYDVRGHRVATLCKETLEAGAHSLTWDGRDDQGQALASGVYLSRLVAGTQVQTKKMMLMK